MYTMMTRELASIMSLTAFGTLWDDLKVGLFTNDVTIGPSMAASDFVQPTYTGYVAQATVDMGTTIDNAAGDAKLFFTPKLFQGDVSGTEPNTIRGWFLYHDGATDLVACAEKYETPVVITNHLDGLMVNPFLAMGQAANPELS